MKPIRIVAVLALALTLAACSTADRQIEPISIGPQFNDLKRSPCACIDITDIDVRS